MPFPVPTRAQLRENFRAFFKARLPGADTTLRFGNVPVAADAMAAGNDAELQYAVYLSLQLFLDTCEGAYLERYAKIYAIARKGAAAAAGNVVFSGLAGTAIPFGTPVQTFDTVPFVFATTASATIGSGGTVSVPVVAVLGGGAGNLAAGAQLAVAVGIAGAQGSATVDTGGFTGGADQESDDSLRARVLTRIRQPPQGGAKNDYVTWAKLVAGVTRAWVYPLNRGAGTVDVAFVLDGRSNIIPLAADITTVQASLDANRPVTADCQAFALTAVAQNIHLAGIATTAQANALAALQALFATTTPGGATVGDGVSGSSPGGTLYLSDIYNAVKQASGVTTFDLVSPTADIVMPNLQIATLGTVTFT